MADATDRARRRWGTATVQDGDRPAAAQRAAEITGPDRARFTGLAAEQRDEQQMRMARAAWQAGQLVPDRITQFLDLGGLEGPEVDEVCLAAEPDVDRWEAGELYPSWEQLVALADLTGAHPLVFSRPAAPRLRVTDTSLRFHLPSPPKRRRPPPEQLDLFPVRDDEDRPPVLRFTPAALAAAAERYGIRPASRRDALSEVPRG